MVRAFHSRPQSVPTIQRRLAKLAIYCFVGQWVFTTGLLSGRDFGAVLAGEPKVDTPAADGAIASDSAAPTDGRVSIELGKHRFTLPTGFSIERVAESPLVDRPIVADFDEEGRLYVADSSGSNEPPAQQLKSPTHRIVRLEDVDGDGRFDRGTVFAEQVMFPEGALWHEGSLYVSAPPSIWKFTDRDGDGVADERSEWFHGGTLTGCANDLHGPYLGRDGWIYWCKGAFAEQRYDLPGRPGWKTRAAHIFRARPDGRDIEPVMTGGMDNPVDVVFTPSGERIFSTTFLQHPGGGKRDGLIHAVYGGVWGKDHDVLNGHVRTSPELMPVLAHLGPAAPCGLTSYDSAAFGSDFANNLFVCEFNLHQVARVALSAAGATLAADVTEFLKSDHIDFHPTDVLEDADGSLLVIDTGGWYKLCCPTSQLDKPDVLGAIYRIRLPGTELNDPRGKKLRWNSLAAPELAKLIGDPRPAVQRRAIAMLGHGGDPAIRALETTVRSERATLARRNAVWAATRHEAGLSVVRRALSDVDESVRQAAAHSVGLRRDREAMRPLLAMLSESSLASRRVAAEAIGRIGDPASIPALLEATTQQTDAVFDHSITHALIEIGMRHAEECGAPLLQTARGANARGIRAALTALDQLDSPKLTSELVVPHLQASDESLRSTAWWIVGRRPDWGTEVATLVRQRLLDMRLKSDERESLTREAAQLAASAPIQNMLAELVLDASTPEAAVSSALRIISAARIKDSPTCWLHAVAERLDRAAPSDEAATLELLECLRSRGLPTESTPELTQVVSRIADDATRSEAARVFAYARIPTPSATINSSGFDLLLQSLASDRPPAQRAAAADFLVRAPHDHDHLMALADALGTVGPLEIDRLLPAFSKSNETPIGAALIHALRRNPSRENARIEVLEPILNGYVELAGETQTLLSELNQGAEQRRAELDRLTSDLPTGDVRQGQAVFHSTKAACYSCHAIGYNGGNVGPDLTQIGKIRSERDLLESILFPSASLVRSYEPVTVICADGRSYNGLVRSDQDGLLVLATGPNQEARIARSDVEEIHPSKVSVMPAGLDKQLSREELADLIAFLKSRQ